eukprot:CAMPEP_0184284062 /NCGR_PEP_ID=MMETSP0977-20130417/65985_1 /TAXON_ID=483370 /ORGANISM="non described non described, Strain CCMP2097" /LENGTH=546 /DNA_ID=CAMNT_0026590073 /DNA_START=1 /DNA_END=1642 /DNA_ORIENTATION=+
MMKELDYFGLETAVFGVRPWTDDATFRPGPAMSSARAYCAASLVGGRVVVFGGTLGETSLNTMLLLDTQTMTFTAGPNMLTERYGCAIVQIDFERVLVVGGYNDAQLNTTEIFHLSTLTFTPGPIMLSIRSGCAAVALDARRIVVVGGHDGTSRLSTTEIFSLDTMAFLDAHVHARAEVIIATIQLAAVALDARRIVVVGGHDGTSRVSTTEIFSLDTMAFAPGPTMATPRNGCAAIALDERRIMVAGGYSGSGGLISTLGPRHPDHGVHARAGYGLGTLLVRGRARRFVVGGHDGRSFLSTTEILSLDTMAFAPGPTLAAPRNGCATVALDEYRIMVAGGRSGSEHLDTTEVLDVRTMAFAPGPSMGSACWGCAAVVVDAQHVLVVCGRDSTGTKLATTELLDVATMEFAARADHADCAQWRRSLVAGGYSGSEIWDTTEILDIRTMAFTPGPQMGSARSYCAAVPVDTHHVLVVGGLISATTKLATTELLDVATMEFAPGPAMSSARSGVAAVRLDAARDARILVLGGSLSSTEVLAVDAQRAA